MLSRWRHRAAAAFALLSRWRIFNGGTVAAKSLGARHGAPSNAL